jgi:circadian clock protein KaiB
MQTDLDEPKSSILKRTEFLFELYIVEEEAHHQEIRDGLKRLFEEYLPGLYQLRIINVQEHPELAAQAHVLATPTLIKLRPKPAHRLVGDIGYRESLLDELKIFSN